MSAGRRRPFAAHACAAALVLTPAAARANGAFPAVSQIVAEPSNPERMFLRGTFGVVTTSDAGASWDWICESAAGYLNIEPPLTVLEGGELILALPRGISRSSSAACEFTMASGTQANMVDVSRSLSEPNRALALATTDVDSSIWESFDAGASWVPLGEPFPDLRATTLDVAATDGDVLYVSGVVGSADRGGYGVVLRSVDRGGSWASFPVPETNSGKKPYIAALDPRDARTVYVRTTGLPGRLFVTRDGGETFQEILRLEVPVQGFALSPDGETVLATNVYDGSFRADTRSFAFEKVACRGPSCLLWNELGLFGCGDDLGDGFIVGRSEDGGRTFENVLDLSCVRGPLACDASTIVGGECPAFWPDIRAQLGAETCAPRVVPPYTECFVEGGAGANSGGSAAQGGGGPLEGEAGAGGAPPELPPQATSPEPRGCGCAIPTTGHHSAFSLVAAALALLCLRRATRHFRVPTPFSWHSGSKD